MTVSQSSSVILNSRLSRVIAGIVDQHAERPELLGDAVDRRGDLPGVGHVRADAEGAPPGLLGDLLRGLCGGGLVEVEQRDVGPVGGKPQRGGGADAACAPGDQGHPAGRARFTPMPAWRPG